MTFTAKLKLLTEGKNKSQIAKSANLSPVSIADYLGKGYVPRADNALHLAKALDVSLLWMIDDRRDELPPPKFEKNIPPSLHNVGDAQLMHELARRYRHLLIELCDEFKSLQQVNWKKIADQVTQAMDSGKLPDAALAAIRKNWSFAVKCNRLRDFDLQFFSTIHHSELPGADRSLADLSLAASGFMAGNLMPPEEEQLLKKGINKWPDWIDPDLRQEAGRVHDETQHYINTASHWTEKSQVPK